MKRFYENSTIYKNWNTKDSFIKKLNLTNLKKYTIGQLVIFPLLFLLLLVPMAFNKSWIFLCWPLIKNIQINALENFTSREVISSAIVVVFLVYFLCFMVYIPITVIFFVNIPIQKSIIKSIISILPIIYAITIYGNSTTPRCIIDFICNKNLPLREILYIANMFISVIVVMLFDWIQKSEEKIRKSWICLLLLINIIILFLPFNNQVIVVLSFIFCLCFTGWYNFDSLSLNISVSLFLLTFSCSTGAPVDWGLALVTSLYLTEIFIQRWESLQKDNKEKLYHEFFKLIKNLLVSSGVGSVILLILTIIKNLFS